MKNITVFIYKRSLYDFDNEKYAFEDNVWSFNASTVRMAFQQLHSSTGIILNPANIEDSPGKYFVLSCLGANIYHGAVDVHVKRLNVVPSICIKQNLDFELLDGDEIRIIPIAC